MSRLTLLQDLNDTSERWCVEVQVLRKWNVFLKSSPNTLASISFLLVDKEVCEVYMKAFFDCLSVKFSRFIYKVLCSLVLYIGNKNPSKCH